VSKPIEQAFTFEINGVARNLFTTYEQNDGTVILNLLPKGSPFHRRFECESSMTIMDTPIRAQAGVAVKQSRYSIHPSDESQNDVNLIKLTHTYENGEEFTSVHFTAGIKQTNMFAPIITRRFDDVRSMCYDIAPSKTKRVKLDDSEPLFTSVVGVFVGPSGRRFDCSVQDDFQFKHVEFTRFTFMFMWSFILLAPRRGHDIHTRTTRDMGPHTFTSDAECVAYFKLQRELLKRELIDSWSYDRNARVAIEATKSAGYFREARTDTPEFNAFAARLRTTKRPLVFYM